MIIEEKRRLSIIKNTAIAGVAILIIAIVGSVIYLNKKQKSSGPNDYNALETEQATPSPSSSTATQTTSGIAPAASNSGINYSGANQATNPVKTVVTVTAPIVAQSSIIAKTSTHKSTVQTSSTITSTINSPNGFASGTAQAEGEKTQKSVNVEQTADGFSASSSSSASSYSSE